MDKIRIAHISDLHFAKISFSPFQFFSKRWIGNFNHLLSRQWKYPKAHLDSLIPMFEELNVNLVVVTGDLSTTSLKGEFHKANAFLAELEERGMRVLSIPGNHDHYTKRAWKKKYFYKVLPDLEGYGLSLKRDGVAATDLNDFWTLIALDTALATPFTSSRGLFTEEQEMKLLSLISSIPATRQILIINHFPLFSHERPSKILERAPALQAILKHFPNIRFYLHGHTHAHCIADLRANGLPIILDSGSTAHHQRGSWNLLDLLPHSAEVQAYRTFTDVEGWQPFRKLSWSFQNERSLV